MPYNTTQKKDYVFISYSSSNKAAADEFKNVLTENGISYWMAPDCIPIGSNYAEVIPDAIEGCSAFILLLSEHAQNSKWVSRELDAAINAEKPILPFHMDDSILSKSFNFYLCNIQRIEAYQRKAAAYEEILTKIKGLVRTTTPAVTISKTDTDKIVATAINTAQKIVASDTAKPNTSTAKKAAPAQSQFDISMTHYNKGIQYEQEENYVKACECFINYTDVSRTIYNAKPTESTCRNFIVGYGKIASMHKKLNNPEEAKNFYRKACHYAEDFLKTHSSSELSLVLSTYYSFLADCQRDDREYDDAYTNYMKTLNIRKKLVEEDNSPLHNKRLASSYEFVGFILYKMEHYKEALDNYQTSKRIFEKLIADNHNDSYVTNELDIVNKLLNNVTERLSSEVASKADILEAYNNRSYEKCVELGETLSMSSMDSETCYAVFDSYESLARKHSNQEAISYYKKCTTYGEHLLTLNAKNTYRQKLSLVYHRLSTICKDQGFNSDADKYHEQCLALKRLLI